MKIHPIFHVSRLKRYVAGGGDGTQPPPPILAEDGEPEYEVDKIVRERGSGRRKEYRVRWKGYGPEEDHWLRAHELENAPDVLREWERTRVQQ